MLKILGYSSGGIILCVLLLWGYTNIPIKTPEKDFSLGTTFSLHYATEIGLDWQKVYVAMLEDLGVRKVRLPVYWNRIEEKEGTYDYTQVDWQVRMAEKYDAKLIMVVGQKVPRWPECFIPEWAQDDTEKKRAALLRFITKTITRYENSLAVVAWQVENEPFLPYGICPSFDKDFLDQEIAVARGADPSRPIVVTDSGELSIWVPTAKRADIFGTTMYRTVYTQEYGYYEYPVGPRFFQLKRALIRMIADQQNAIVIELQGEPWLAGVTTEASLDDQLENLNAKKLRENGLFARHSGLSEANLSGF